MAGHLVKYGKHRVRRSYSRIKEVLELPNLIEIQTDSYKWFLDEGLREMFEEIMPIEDFAGKLSLEFVNYQLLEPKYTVDEAREHDANYSAPLHVTLRLINKETGEIIKPAAQVSHAKDKPEAKPGDQGKKPNPLADAL